MIILAILAFTFFGGLCVSNNFACSCIPSPMVKESYERSSAVFVGEVIEIVQKPDVFFVEVKFKIEQKWNEGIGKIVTINTGKGGGDCGYQFEVGKKYLVYASQGNKGLNTNFCTRTALAENNKDIAVLNKIKKRKTKSSPK